MCHEPLITPAFDKPETRPRDGTAVVHPAAGSVAPPQEACLVLIHPPGPDLGHRYPLGTPDVVIGRQPGSGVTSVDPSVSWNHAYVVRLPDGSFQVTDLGSTNGTYIDHARIKTDLLRDGCYLQVGTSVYRFLAGGNVETQYHDEIVRLSATDSLTGLPNRRVLDDALAREVVWAATGRRPLALLLVDVDQFKLFNDRFGHPTGDQILRALAARLGAVMRDRDTLARYGGEEFAAILPGADGEAAGRVAERLRAVTVDAPFVVDGRPHRVTISVGVGVLRAGESSPGHLLRRADERLYEAKQAGRNRVGRDPRVGQTRGVGV